MCSTQAADRFVLRSHRQSCDAIVVGFQHPVEISRVLCTTNVPGCLVFVSYVKFDVLQVPVLCLQAGERQDSRQRI